MPSLRCCHATIALSILLVLTTEARPAEHLSVTPEQMKVALRTDTQEEDGFVEDVVDRVTNEKRPRTERLPAEMVEGTFQWARRKSRLRFQYFKRGLTLRAAKIGVRLD